MRGWAASEISKIPQVVDLDPDTPQWHPLQHFLGLSAFGANVFVATEAGQTLVGEHDESASGQEELYVVLSGVVDFQLDGERLSLSEGGVVAVNEPRITRVAVSSTSGAALLAIGCAPGSFHTTWRMSHFTGIPTAQRADGYNRSSAPPGKGREALPKEKRESEPPTDMRHDAMPQSA